LNNINGKELKLKVKWRGGFSDREGYFPTNKDIQLDSLDDRVRTRIYNLFKERLKIERVKSISGDISKFGNAFLKEFYLTDLDFHSRYKGEWGEEIFLQSINDTIYLDHWANVFTFIEFWALIESVTRYCNYSFEEKINSILEREFVGYRLVNNLIVPITNQIEIESIQDALNNPYDEVNKHIHKALQKLSDRENPDYENSIKESISAVEAMVRIIVGKEGAMLGDGLKKLEDSGINIHPALKGAFSNLYGYTSDESGIRHAQKMGGANSTFDEAKFMLVSCCAFNSYLLGNSK
jgi:hypothetical protein